MAEEVPILASSTLRAIDARSAALLVSGQQGGDLELRLLAFGTPGAGTAPGAIELVLDVHATALAPAEEQERVPLLVYFYALDPRGRVLGTVKQGIALDGVALTAPWRAGVKFVGRIELPPGDYTVRALAVRRDTGAFGLVHGAASVPASDTAAPAAFALELA
ncbi:MAG TPA: hypothetical protein VI942_01855, partial [Thermoanaerobaculia bacterium]|nr:hypothetical protein [Thermoanaerobaculia bacterium]